MPRACAVCGSRKWRKDAVTGSAVCEEGHVYQDYVAEVLDADVGTQHFALHRRKKGKAPGSRSRKRDNQANPEFYHGLEAEWLRIEALQLLLRHQVAAIRKIFGLSEVYETIVRDLWTYQLATTNLPNPPTSDDDEQPGPRGTRHGPAHGSGTRPQEPHGHEKEDVIGESSDSDDDQEDANDEQEKEDDVDSVLLEELEKGYDDDSETGEHYQGTARGQDWKKKRKLRASNVVVTVIIGLWMMRIPFTYIMIQDLINHNEVPYIDFAHSTLLPANMKRHMNREITLALSPPSSPTPMLLYRQACLFARVLTQRFGLDLPELNLPPVAWHVIGSLGGTAATYEQIARLLDSLDINLNLVPTTLMEITARLGRRGRPKASQSKPQNEEYGDSPAQEEEKMISFVRTSKRRDMFMPELAVAASMILLWKMAYGLDGDERRAEADDPLVELPTSGACVQGLSDRLDEQAFSLDSAALHQRTPDWASASADEIDRFLDQAEQVLLRGRQWKSSAETVPFELPQKHRTTIRPQLSESWKDFRQFAPLTPAIASPGMDEEDNPAMLLPGEQLKVYDAADHGGSIPPDLHTAVRAAAEVVGVPQSGVLEALELLERRLQAVRAGKNARLRLKSWPGSRVNSTAPSRITSLQDLASHAR